MRRTSAFILALCLVFALCACSSRAAETTETEAPAEETSPEVAGMPDTASEPENTGVPDAVPAAEAVNVKVTLAVEGSIVAAPDGTLLAVQDLVVTDCNGNGFTDIDDTLATLHDAYCPGGYASAVGDYGLAITKLWNDESGAFGYYVDNVAAYSLEDPVEEGSYIVAFVYADKAGYTDVYAYFDRNSIRAETGSDIGLMVNMTAFDESWNPVTRPLAGAEVAVVNADGSLETVLSTYTGKSVTSDENGFISIVNHEPGNYIFTVTAPEGTILVPPVCLIEVEG